MHSGPLVAMVLANQQMYKQPQHCIHAGSRKIGIGAARKQNGRVVEDGLELFRTVLQH